MSAFENLVRSIEKMDAGPRADLERLAADVEPDDVMDIGFTSGTTGAPKGVQTTHGQNIRVYETYSGTVGLREDDNYLIISPFFHSFGYKGGWLSCLIHGATALPHGVFTEESVLQRVQDEKQGEQKTARVAEKA